MLVPALRENETCGIYSECKCACKRALLWGTRSLCRFSVWTRAGVMTSSRRLWFLQIDVRTSHSEVCLHPPPSPLLKASWIRLCDSSLVSPQVTSDQLVLLLELLLEEAELSTAAMGALARTYDFRNQDPEVRRRVIAPVVEGPLPPRHQAEGLVTCCKLSCNSNSPLRRKSHKDPLLVLVLHKVP